MRAAVVDGFGGPDRLRYGTVPDPAPAPGWVVVELRASALNWHDVLVRQGRYDSPLPHVPGADGAGVADGQPVMILPSLWWGENERVPGPRFEILGDRRPGTYAELVRVPEECVVPKPAGLGWHEAAALPLAGATCYRALFSRGRLTAGESVLVVGAGGGVATMAVALAAGVGAHVVVASSSLEKIERARELGAADGVLYTDPSWVEPGRFDLVLDPVGRWEESLRALRPGGRLVTLGASRAETARVDIRSFFFGQFDLLGTTMGSPRDFAGLLALMDRERIPPPVIDTVFPLDEAHLAHERMESGAGFGKIVLDCQPNQRGQR
jgi:zinc-binding alcohol dehydrogenase/oxidoreductase